MLKRFVSNPNGKVTEKLTVFLAHIFNVMRFYVVIEPIRYLLNQSYQWKH